MHNQFFIESMSCESLQAVSMDFSGSDEVEGVGRWFTPFSCLSVLDKPLALP